MMPTVQFRVVKLEHTSSAGDEFKGWLDDGRAINISVTAGELSIEVSNPEKSEGGRLYALHEDPRVIFLKAFDPANWMNGSLSFDELKAHTTGFIAWPEKLTE